MVFLTATSGAADATVGKIWNLVDWLILQWQPSMELAGVIEVVGAFLCMVLAYLIGSVNFSILLSKRIYGGDIRQYRTGNADVTDVLLVYGKKAALLTLICDAVKVVIAVWIGRLLWEHNGGALSGFFVVFGHMFPLYFRFKGGKGALCMMAVAATLSPITFLLLLVIFLIGAIGTRMMSFASVMTAFLYPLVLQAFASRGLNVAMAVFTTAFVVGMHWGNLKLMQAGKEEKLELEELFSHKKR